MFYIRDIHSMEREEIAKRGRRVVIWPVEVKAFELGMCNECADVLHFNDKRTVVRHETLYIFDNLVWILDVREYATRDNHIRLTILSDYLRHRWSIKKGRQSLKPRIVSYL